MTKSEYEKRLRELEDEEFRLLHSAKLRSDQKLLRVKKDSRSKTPISRVPKYKRVTETQKMKDGYDIQYTTTRCYY